MRKTIKLILWVILVLVVIYLGHRILLFTFKPGLTINSSGSVVKEMRQLNRLETAQFTMEKIIDAGYQGNFFQNILYGDRILLVAHGEVTAGFDLSQLDEDDVKIKVAAREAPDDTSSQTIYWLTITLPPPQIFHSILDNEKTRVYDRRTGFLAKPDKDLESTARAQAESALRSEACEAGILKEASDNAQSQLGHIFQAAGFGEVRIIIPEGECK